MLNIMLLKSFIFTKQGEALIYIVVYHDMLYRNVYLFHTHTSLLEFMTTL